MTKVTGAVPITDGPSSSYMPTHGNLMYKHTNKNKENNINKQNIGQQVESKNKPPNRFLLSSVLRRYRF